MHKEKEIKKEFKKWKDNYGRCNYSLWQGDVSEMIRKDWKTAVKMLKPRKNQRILDVACGNGLAAIEIAKKTYPEIAYGVDITKELLSEARKNARKQKVENIKFKLASVRDIPSKDNIFDGAICTNAAHHFHKPVKMFKEIRRVLKNGSRFILVDTCATSKRIKEFEKKLKKEEKAHCRFFGLSEIRDILSKAGFSSVKGFRKDYSYYVTAVA